MLNRILTHFTARRKPSKEGVKPSSGHPMPTGHQGVLLDDYDEGPVPSYPPFQHGIPAASVRQVMETQSQLILQIKEQLGLAPKEWEKVVHPMLVRYAEIVHLLPASEAHHHRGAGGLFRHGLEAGFWACRSAENKIFTKAKTPLLRRGEGKRWEVAALTGGLAHDVGKTISDVSVTDREGLLEWNPHQPLAQWLAEHKARRYFLHWNGGREHKRHESFSVLFMAHIIQGTTKAYLLSHPEVMDQLLRVVSGQGEDTEFGKVVLWADRQSVSRDLKHQRISPDEFAYGVPVEKYVLDALRSLLGTKEYQPNKPPFVICVAQEGVYLKWQNVVTAILAQLRQDDIRGVPSNPDTLARLLIERGLATGRPAPTPDAPDAYFLYHEMKPRAKGLASLAKSGADKYLLIHDPDMVFPSTALPQTMEVELTPIEDRRTATTAPISPSSSEQPISLEKNESADTSDGQDDAEGEATRDPQIEPAIGAAPAGAEANATGSPQNAVGEGAHGQPPTPEDIETVGSHISFEDLISGNLNNSKHFADSAEGDNGTEVSSESSGSEHHEQHHDDPSSDGHYSYEPEPSEADPSIGGELFDGTDSETTTAGASDDFDLDALINNEVGSGDSSREASSGENAQSGSAVEIPDFLKSVALQNAPQDEDDSIEYEDIESEVVPESASDVPADAGQSHDAPQTPLDAPSELPSTATVSQENRAPESPQSDLACANIVNPQVKSPQPALTADSSGEAPLEASPDASEPLPKGVAEELPLDPQVERTAKILASETATPRELLAEADMRLIKKRENEERFQKRQKRKLDKAAKSTTDQFDVDATLEAKKRGKPLSLTDVRADKNKDSELAKTVKAIGVYVPGIDDVEDAAISNVQIKKTQVDISQVETPEPRPRQGKVEIESLLDDGQKRRGSKTAAGAKGKTEKKVATPSNQSDTKQQRKAVLEEKPADTSPAAGQDRKLDQTLNEQPDSKELNGVLDQPKAGTNIEPEPKQGPDRGEIISLYQHIQQDMLSKTKSHLPNVDVALIADSIIYSLATRAEPLGNSAYFSGSGRMLIRYPSGIEGHLPGRPKTQDMARLAREMKQAALVSHLNGGRAQDGPVQRDPETGEMVLAFTIAINKLVQKLLNMIGTCIEAGEELPALSRLTHKSQESYEVARKEIQSSIDKHKSDNDSANDHNQPESATQVEEPNMPASPGSVETVIQEIVQSRQGAAANKKNINIAVLKVIASQVVTGKGSLIDDAPITEKRGVVSVQKSIVERASKAANHKHVTSLTLSVHTKWLKEGMSAVGMGIKGVSVSNGRFCVYLKSDN